MQKLYVSLLSLALLFSAGMSFVTLGVYQLQWWWAVVGVGLVVVLVALGGLLVPPTLKSLAGGQLATAKAAVQAFGAFCGAEFFTMAVITWALGNRTATLHTNNAYQTLGLLIFLGLIGVGIMGALAMLARFLYVRNRTIVVPRREVARPHAT